MTHVFSAFKLWEKRETNFLAEAFTLIREKTVNYEADWNHKD